MAAVEIPGRNHRWTNSILLRGAAVVRTKVPRPLRGNLNGVKLLYLRDPRQAGEYPCHALLTSLKVHGTPVRSSGAVCRSIKYRSSLGPWPYWDDTF